MDQGLNDLAVRAVAHFWQTRLRQNESQGASSGRRDRGERAAVTGGRQLDGFITMIRTLRTNAGVEQPCIHIDRRRAILPGYFRPTKEWDIVVAVGRQLLATIELKSQVGPSFGNNFNNRTEEAIGSAQDFWTAYREGAFRDSRRPWLGYLMLLESAEGSTRSVAVEEPHFPVFEEFRGASYARRYQLLCERLVRERLYDAACLLTSTRREGVDGVASSPSDELSLAGFVASLVAHVAAHTTFS